ncbi:hypothetical protein [Spirosoma utsteinense]|uniref:IrrE N-terminal-like domain-containing protein n=1 Tax=Spirosoma utsteinense TaxID=2585773 RepID=A0ABR6W3N9_9BACT|nr:hypothetical protein [Spirosoma utsteinense]MBC3788154.1 hypothetical protein [Spirosoma utsteinense]MBC3790497.1 hypothetical protein [Spirosoma utsteinense]
MRPALVLSLLVLALSCQSPSQPTPVPATEPAQYSVPAEVEPYVAIFRDMARQRNMAIQADNLIITFGKTTEVGACGQCLLETGKTPRITLSTDPTCWKQVSTNERECLVLHELGHCLLKRPHLTTRFPTGMYASLMNPDDIGVYATCIYPLDTDVCDKRPRRNYYIDELFNPTTPVPVWSNQ